MKIMEEIQALLLRKFDHLLEKLKIRGDPERIHRKTGKRPCYVVPAHAVSRSEARVASDL